jgi:hypothetical protein
MRANPDIGLSLSGSRLIPAKGMPSSAGALCGAAAVEP